MREVMANEEDQGGRRVTSPEYRQQTEFERPDPAIPLGAAAPHRSDPDAGTSRSRVNTASEGRPNLTSHVKDAKDQAAKLADDAKEQTAELAGQARQHVSTLIADQKQIAAERLGSFAGMLRDAAQTLEKHDVGDSIGSYTNRAADQIDAISKYVRTTSFQTMLGDAGQFARRRPEVFLGGTLLAGLLVARFLKASTPRNTQAMRQAGDC
jgi:hypothetical protein